MQIRNLSKRKPVIFLIVFLLMGQGSVWAGIRYPDMIPPGKAQIKVEPQHITIFNNLLRLQLVTKGKRLRSDWIRDERIDRKIDLSSGELFRISTGPDRNTYAGSDFVLTRDVEVISLEGEPEKFPAAQRYNGIEVKAALASPDKKLSVDWRVELRDGSNYLRQFVEIKPTEDPVTIQSIEFNDFLIEGVSVVGRVSGSPLAAGSFFLAYEHPTARQGMANGSEATSTPKRVFCRLDRNTVLRPGQSLRQSAVIGVASENQRRRGFLYYLERERAHPYHQYLHYNSWYHLNIGRNVKNRMTEAECLATIHHVGRELVQKRGVVLDGFVWDDGWDDFHSLWNFHEGFPNGFAKMATAVGEYKARTGVWMSPWGGYGKAKQLRMEYGKQHGYETNRTGFSLAGPTYYKCYRDRCLQVMREYGVNFFKFDGIGGGSVTKGVGGELAADVEAMLRLIGEIRTQDPSVYISATTGTWPSPFFLLATDNIWRQGNDTAFHGVGSNRQQWITYRDMFVYRNIVQAGPLYPLNALMPHGLVIGDRFNPGQMERDPVSIADEIWMMFGCGTSLLELYITPTLLTETDWDVLARAARWARGNSDVLVDTHWVGGDPGKLDIYGYASWNQRQGILVLRNPDEKAKSITLDVGAVFELPQGAPKRYRLTNPTGRGVETKSIFWEVGTHFKLTLKSFEVLVFDANPAPVSGFRNNTTI